MRRKSFVSTRVNVENFRINILAETEGNQRKSTSTLIFFRNNNLLYYFRSCSYACHPECSHILGQVSCSVLIPHFLTVHPFLLIPSWPYDIPTLTNFFPFHPPHSATPFTCKRSWQHFRRFTFLLCFHKHTTLLTSVQTGPTLEQNWDL